ncbi:MAG: hypothetical protein KDB03_01895 [Planctomycetales bacterium]|nr:hypothetical protein [Planctomycetales bacterium]
MRFISTPSATHDINVCGFQLHTILEDREDTIREIAHGNRQIGSHPLRLLRQLKSNISMMDQLVIELRELWKSRRPDLVVVDFAVPVAGLLAQSLGIAWWTALSAPSVFETRDCIPAYLGGWKPTTGPLGELRNWMGRTIIRTFKRCAMLTFAKTLHRLGIRSAYAADGYEFIYSRQQVLVHGPIEFEFPGTWPSWVRFIGPQRTCPSLVHQTPPYVNGKRHVLISLGTHVSWAKERAIQLVKTVSQKMPELEFHFTRGNHNNPNYQQAGNFHEIPYIPYQQYIDRYALSINHAGTGILFACLRSGLPILAWPQDFDQFDNTARLTYHGLGLRCRPQLDLMINDLRTLLDDAHMRNSSKRMAQTIASYDAAKIVLQLIAKQFGYDHQ